MQLLLRQAHQRPGDADRGTGRAIRRAHRRRDGRHPGSEGLDRHGIAAPAGLAQCLDQRLGRARGARAEFLGRAEALALHQGQGFLVAELSPYELDLDWEELTEPDEIRPVLAQLGRATAKLHCVGDADSDHTVVDFPTEAAIAEAVAGREEEFVAQLVDFAVDYADRVWADHALFVSAFREGRIGAVDAVR